MKIGEINTLLNPNGDNDIEFKINAAIEHIKSFTNQDFRIDEELDLPYDLVHVVKKLVESADDPNNVSSVSVGGELSKSYFSLDATESVKSYLLPYRKLRW